MFEPGKTFQRGLIFEGKFKRLPYSRAIERCSAQVGSCLTCKYYARQKSLTKGNHYLICTSVTKEKSSITLTTGINAIQLFSSSLMLQTNKLGCFSATRLLNLVSYFPDSLYYRCPLQSLPLASSTNIRLLGM